MDMETYSKQCIQCNQATEKGILGMEYMKQIPYEVIEKNVLILLFFEWMPQKISFHFLLLGYIECIVLNMFP